MHIVVADCLSTDGLMADSCRLNVSCKKILKGSWEMGGGDGDLLNDKGDEEKFLFGCYVGNLGKRLFFFNCRF